MGGYDSTGDGLAGQFCRSPDPTHCALASPLHSTAYTDVAGAVCAIAVPSSWRTDVVRVVGGVV